MSFSALNYTPEPLRKKMTQDGVDWFELFWREYRAAQQKSIKQGVPIKVYYEGIPWFIYIADRTLM